MWVGKLLQVAQGANAVVVSAKADRELASGVTRHERSRGGVVPKVGSSVRGSEAAMIARTREKGREVLHPTLRPVQ